MVSLADIKTSQKNDELWFNFINNFPEDTIIFALVTLKSIYFMYRSEDKFLSRFVRLAGGYFKNIAFLLYLYAVGCRRLLVCSPARGNSCLFSRVLPTVAFFPALWLQLPFFLDLDKDYMFYFSRGQILIFQIPVCGRGLRGL